MAERFSTDVLDHALAKRKERREQRRQERLGAVFDALDRLSLLISFQDAYVFGSLARPYGFFDGSDVDVAFVGLRNDDFFRAMSFLEQELAMEVDVVQLEGNRLREKIMREGVRWKKRD